MRPHLYIGNRNYSSWSLRPWLCLRWAGIDFDETRIELDRPGYGYGGIAEIRAVSPSGKVPALRVGDTTIWDSLAIAEWAAEHGAGAPLWPADPLARARARSVAAEMHSGFVALRRDLPMNLRVRAVADGLPADTLADLARVDALWSGLRAEHAARGPWLFGARTIADAFLLPVATRMRSYRIALSPPAGAYRDTLLADGDFGEWERRAAADAEPPFSQARLDGLYPPAS